MAGSKELLCFSCSEVSSVFNDGSGEDSKKLASIRQRVRLIAEARDALGPPVPTQEFPTPHAEAKCKFCKRSFATTRNPLKKRGSPFLEASRVFASDCLPCRNAQNWAFKGWTKADLSEKIDNDSSFAIYYLMIVFIWEERANNPEEAIIQNVAEFPPALTAAINSKVTVPRLLVSKLELFKMRTRITRLVALAP